MSAVYPWGGEFVIGSQESCVAVVTLASAIALPRDLVAIHGPMKTENIGIEKVVANVISNPRIRYLLLCGEEVRGHRSGATMMALHLHGIGERNRVVSAPGAVPYIENIDVGAVERFRAQVEIVDMIGCTDHGKIVEKVRELLGKDPGSFGEPYLVERVKPQSHERRLSDIVALHRTLALDPYGEVRDVQLRD
ncbi:MAG: tetrahydromethanopterin S-methyltransferase subunit A [Candidatus Thermoplasmatota archaeon]